MSAASETTRCGVEGRQRQGLGQAPRGWKMALQISESIAKHLPPIARNAVGRMDAEQQSVFEETYKRRKRSPVLLLILAIIFPIQHFLEGKVVSGLIFWLTIGGFGVWWLLDIFMVYGRTRRYNEDLATTTVRDMKIMER